MSTQKPGGLEIQNSAISGANALKRVKKTPSKTDIAHITCGNCVN